MWRSADSPNRRLYQFGTARARVCENVRGSSEQFAPRLDLGLARLGLGLGLGGHLLVVDFVVTIASSWLEF